MYFVLFAYSHIKCVSYEIKWSKFTIQRNSNVRIGSSFYLNKKLYGFQTVCYLTIHEEEAEEYRYLEILKIN